MDNKTEMIDKYDPSPVSFSYLSRAKTEYTRYIKLHKYSQPTDHAKQKLQQQRTVTGQDSITDDTDIVINSGYKTTTFTQQTNQNRTYTY